MAINNTTAPKIFLFTKRASALPIGYWYVALSQAGDASGTIISNTIKFASQKEVDEYLFSVDGVNLRANGNQAYGHVACDLQTPFPAEAGTGTLDLWWTIPWLNSALGQDSATHNVSPPSIIFPSRGNIWDLIVQYPNVNGTTNILAAWGYMWDYNVAVKIPGGPVRPGGQGGFSAPRGVIGGGP